MNSSASAASDSTSAIGHDSATATKHGALRRWVLRVLVAICVGVSLWWVHWLPINRDRLYSAIPNEATVVVEQVALASRWSQWMQNPLLRNLILLEIERNGQDIPPSALTAAQTARLAERFVGQHAVLAYAPFFSGSEDDAWVLASWVGGGFLHRMRWNSFLGGLKGAEAIEIGRGERAWVFADRTDGTGKFLSLAIVDGALLVCWSKQARGVERLIYRKKAGARIAAALRAKRDPQPGSAAAHPIFRTATDRGWVQSVAPQSFKPFGPAIRFAVTALDAQGARGWIGMEPPLAQQSVIMPERIMKDDDGPALSDADWSSLESVLGDSAAVLVVAPFAATRRMLASRFAHPVARTLEIRLAAAAAEASPVFAALLRPAYNGRALGFSAPGFLLGFRVRNPELAERTVADLLDILNAGFGLGLIPQIQTEPHRRTIVVGGVNANAFQELKLSERPAFAVVGDWLLFAVHRRTLETMLDAQREDGTVAAWRQSVQNISAPALAWMEFNDAGAAFARLSALYGLLAHAMPVPEEQAVRRTLTGAARFARAAQDLGSGLLVQRPDTGGREFDVVLGAGFEPAQP